MKNTVCRRETPKAKRPDCELWPTAQVQANPHVKVYNLSLNEKGEVVKVPNGILLVRYDNGLSILRFTDDPDGSTRWVPRSVRSKDGKKLIFIYDRIDVPKKMIPELIKGLQEYMSLADIPEDVTVRALERRKKTKDNYKLTDMVKKVFG